MSRGLIAGLEGHHIAWLANIGLPQHRNVSDAAFDELFIGSSSDLRALSS